MCFSLKFPSLRFKIPGKKLKVSIPLSFSVKWTVLAGILSSITFMQTACQGLESTCRLSLTWAVSAGPPHPWNPFTHPRTSFKLTPSTQTWPELHQKCICACPFLLLSCFEDCFLLDYFQSYAVSKLCLLFCFQLCLQDGPWIYGGILSPAPDWTLNVVHHGALSEGISGTYCAPDTERASCWWCSCCVGLPLGSQLIPALGEFLILLLCAGAVVERCILSFLLLF